MITPTAHLTTGTIGFILAISCSAPVAAQACGTADLVTHEVYRCVQGDGSPTIVLAAGAGLTSTTWSGLVPMLAEVGTVVTFDRAGLGNSEPGPLPRTPSVIAEETKRVIEAVDVTGPFILVGHSAGGVHMLRLAERLDDVIGVIIVDTPPPDFETLRRGLLTESERVRREQVLQDGLRRTPPIVSDERRGMQDDATRGFHSFPRNVPLIVVVADAQNFGNLGSQEAHRELWARASHDWLSLSDYAQMERATGSGHMIHVERPELITHLVTRLITRSRQP